jgi:hypothetical protein
MRITQSLNFSSSLVLFYLSDISEIAGLSSQSPGFQSPRDCLLVHEVWRGARYAI